MDHDVFLSYSTKDKTAAEAVCVALERRGVGVWMAPRDIPPGSSYAASIVEAIDSARVLVLIFSAAANGSQDIEREVQRANSKRLKIVPFRIEDVEPKASLAYFLPSRQYLDAFRPPMEARYDELSEVVRKIAPAAQPSPTPSGDVKPPPPPVAATPPAIPSGSGGDRRPSGRIGARCMVIAETKPSSGTHSSTPPTHSIER